MMGGILTREEQENVMWLMLVQTEKCYQNEFRIEVLGKITAIGRNMVSLLNH